MNAIRHEILEQSSSSDTALILINKINSLLEMGLNCDFTSCKPTNWHGYLYTISDLVKQIEDELIK